MKRVIKYKEVPITHRVYPITGFILSGYIFWFPGWVKLPNPHTKKWESMRIPDKIIKPIYIGLELLRKIRLLLKSK
ncbi:hypothetical protein KAR91_32085 [Candidatus Pacearchaeota archaeon]|nr:hypothetical protein [Candidatus Pacearchaeota archaeon]